MITKSISILYILFIYLVQLNNNEQISGKINQQLNNNIYNRTKQSFNNNSDVTVKNRMKSNRCNQNIHEDNCTKLNLNKSVNNVSSNFVVYIYIH